jgi:hypothetical protein
VEHPCPIVGHKTEFHSAVPIEITFNSTKSKFVVVGKRTDKHKQWSLGNDKIGEDNNYKYFGV